MKLDDNVDQAINQLMWGYSIITVKNCKGDEMTVLLRPASISQKNLAHYYYMQEFQKAQEDGILLENEILSIAEKNGEWTKYDKDILEKYDEMVIFAEEEINKTPFQSKKRSLKRQLDDLKKKRHMSDDKRTHLVSHSAEYCAKEKQITYLIKSIAVDINDNLLFSNSITDQILFWNIIEAYLKTQFAFDHIFIRKIARSNQWRTRWVACKNRPLSELFGRNFYDITDDQFLLVYWSQVYDSVYQSLDCPPDNVIEDDEKLDEWIKNQNAKQNNERTSKYVEEKDKIKHRGFYDASGKYHSHGRRVSDHHEVGINVSGELDPKTGRWRQYTQEEKEQKISEIYGKNTISARRVLAQEANRIEKDKMIKEEKLRNRRTMMLLGKSDTQGPSRRRQRG